MIYFHILYISASLSRVLVIVNTGKIYGSESFIITFFILLLASNIAYSEVCRHTDENGKVYYSDKPTEGSEKIELENTYIEKDKNIRQKQLKNNKKLIDNYNSELRQQGSEDERNRARSESEQKSKIARKRVNAVVLKTSGIILKKI